MAAASQNLSNAAMRVKTGDTSKKASNGQAVSKRLNSDLMTLMKNPAPGVSAFPQNFNVFSWVGTISGAPETAYEGLTYKLSLSFPSEYPYSAPSVKFETPCYHPNVDQHGNICLDILKDQWSALYDVRTVLLSIQSLLGEPNVDSPLNGPAAALWSNQPLFREQLAKQYAEHVTSKA